MATLFLPSHVIIAWATRPGSSSEPINTSMEVFPLCAGWLLGKKPLKASVIVPQQDQPQMESFKLVSNVVSKSLPLSHLCQVLLFAGQNDITQLQTRVNKGLTLSPLHPFLLSSLFPPSFLLSFFDRFVLCSSGWLWTHNPLVSASLELVLQASTTIFSLESLLFKTQAECWEWQLFPSLRNNLGNTDSF